MVSTFRQFITEQAIPGMPWNGNPKIGWWLDSDPVTFYHGTHIRNIDYISKHGLTAPTEGSTAGWVSLAIEPNTAFGYAAMSGAGGETTFRNAGARPVNTPKEERAVFVLRIPQKYFIPLMAQMRGAVTEYKDKLTNKEKYENFKGSDAEYYLLTEIRLPHTVPAKFIKGVMQKR